jgi:hypothetical protein
MPFTHLPCELQARMAAPGLQLLGESYDRLVGMMYHDTVQRTANAPAVKCVCLDMSDELIPHMRPLNDGEAARATGLILALEITLDTTYHDLLMLVRAQLYLQFSRNQNVDTCQVGLGALLIVQKGGTSHKVVQICCCRVGTRG